MQIGYRNLFAEPAASYKMAEVLLQVYYIIICILCRCFTQGERSAWWSWLTAFLLVCTEYHSAHCQGIPARQSLP